MIRFFRKYHKWLGLIFAILIIQFAISGIVLNHRRLFASVNINRKLLPEKYHYKNWNLAAVRGSLKIQNDSVLLYGNIGIWLTDTSFSGFSDFAHGFPEGMDNRKISRICFFNRKLVAGSFFGLYDYDFASKKWRKITLPVKEDRIVDITVKADTLIVLTRSYLLKTLDFKRFSVVVLPPPEGYDNKASLFKTLWVIHSGEIYGQIGKLIVDLVGLIYVFLTITGLIVFINGFKMKKNITEARRKRLVLSSKWNIKWHNKIGWMTAILLIITASTGMFLRPPFLLFIEKGRIKKIPGTELDTHNAWFDKLRGIQYNSHLNGYIVATSDGFYFAGENLHKALIPLENQPPVSVMGLNVFVPKSDTTYLVGSFSGLYLWDIANHSFQPYPPGKSIKEVEQWDVAGYSDDFKGQEIVFNYDTGALNLCGGDVPVMPAQIRNLPVSLWNTALEFHTCRIYEPLLGGFYILLVPLTGLVSVFLIISGFIVWLKHRN